ncbi:FAD-dependent oxidoreductase [Pedococcus sp. P5_B7]
MGPQIGSDTPKEALKADLVVLGGGMAGLTAAAYAASAGARVVLLEKAAEVGGSAMLSGGGLVCPRDPEDFVKLNPSGEPSLIRRLFANYLPWVEWIESLGVELSEMTDAREIVGFPTFARTVDVRGFVARASSAIVRAGGHILTSVTTDRLVLDSGTVVGAAFADRDGGGAVLAPWTVIATGGFQNDRDLRRRHLGAGAESIVVRSNTQSAGDGLRLGIAAGAGIAGCFDRFYGHTMPDLGREMGPIDYIRHAQFYLSPRSVLLDSHGSRFVDESHGYYVSARALLAQPNQRALLVGDDRVRQDDHHITGFRRTAGLEQLDRIDEARREGGIVESAPTLAELNRLMTKHGYAGVAEAIELFNHEVETDADGMSPGRRLHRHPIVAAPFWAMVVQPAITFTFGGLKIDDQARVLSAAGTPVPGLLAAGADTGGVYCESYSGGLSLAGTFGFQAADTAGYGFGSAPGIGDT